MLYWECHGCKKRWHSDVKACPKCGANNPHTNQQIIVLSVPGRCAQCGCETRRWDTKWEWYICENHNSMEVARSIAEHVMYPNRE